ncbi:hypothetical protein KAU11_12415 [Candidatus Babeliales bacterium]|nr:hypothetical protein [Candidatus Babeliales bacterium]
MAIASYTTDLTDIDLAEVVTNYSALGGGGAGLAADIDFALQGTYSLTKQVSNALKGIVYNNASVTIGADDHFYVWLYCTTPGMLDTEANGGMRVTIGTSTANYTEWYVKGAAEYAEGGWICFPVRYQTTAPSPGSITGTPGASPTHVGGQIFTTAAVKAVNFGLDAQRIGSGIVITGGTGADPLATFTGAADKNDLVANRWGQLANKPGGFALQGKILIGDSGNACELTETGKLITITDTPFTLTDFSEIMVEHASSIVNLTGFTFLGLGSNNKGRFECITSAATVNLTSTIFKDFGACIFGTGTTLDACQWNTTDSITLNGGTMTGCTVDQNIAATAVFTDDLNDISNCTFKSDGTGHALELSSVAGSPVTWDSTDSGYAAIDGSTGNETIYVNVASGSVIINVSTGASTPTIRTAGATVTVNVGQVTTELTVKSLTLGTAISGARVYMIAKAGGPLTIGTVIFNTTTNGSGVVSDTRSLASDQPVEGWIRHATTSPFYKQAVIDATISSTNGLTQTYQLVDDE